MFIGFTTHGDTFYAVLGGPRPIIILFSSQCQKAHESGRATSGYMKRTSCKVLFAPRMFYGVVVEGATTMLPVYEGILAHAKKLGQLITFPCDVSRTPYQSNQTNPNRETRWSTSRLHPRSPLPLTAMTTPTDQLNRYTFSAGRFTWMRGDRQN